VRNVVAQRGSGEPARGTGRKSDPAPAPTRVPARGRATYRCGVPAGPLHVTNGDAVVPELAAAAGVEPAEVLVWHDVLHDGPVPGGLGIDALAEVRARHLASRSWDDERTALATLRRRDAGLAAHPRDAEMVLWFEDDLFDALQLAQIEDRLAGRPGPVAYVHLPHSPRGDLAAALAARRPIDPDPTPFAALRSGDPRAWLDVPPFARLLEELPDSRTGLTRLERQILEALEPGPLTPDELFTTATASEHPPWVGDAPLLALADDLAPLVARSKGRYQLTATGAEVLAGATTRPRTDRWLGGVHLGPGHPDWAFNASSRRPVLLD
jgi:hypothetical protein